MNGTRSDEDAILADEGIDPQGKRTEALSARERDVVKVLAEGLTDAQIADRLVVSPRTVNSHVRNAMQATGTTSRTHLAVLALREGLVPVHLDEER